MPANDNTSFWGRQNYILSEGGDWIWIVLAPLWAVAVGWLLAFWFIPKTITIFDTTELATYFFYMSITQAHLFITVFRTHLNRNIFHQYFWRFTLVPILLVFAATQSPWAFAVLFTITVFWDVYHSSMQIFGLARLFDLKAGNDPNQGRVADYLLCFMMYVGPVLAGALLASHLATFILFESLPDIDIGNITISSGELAGVPASILFYQDPIQKAVIYIIVATAILYLASLIQGTKKGYLIANLFHAVQYFALIWAYEQDSIRRTFGRNQLVRLTLYLSIPISLGLLSIALDSNIARALLVVCALMHFWWDGFIWSVREPGGYNSRN